MNRIIIKGRLTADPETRTAQTGTTITTFTVAVDRPYKSDGKREADFFRCAAFRERGEFIQKYFGKGKEILLEGSMQSRTYEAQDGSKRNAWELMVDRAEFCGSAAGTQPQTTPDGFVDATDEALPF